MDTANPYEAPRSDLSPPDDWPVAFLGALVGPVLGVLFSQARIGPAGHFWFQGKGGETILASRGRTILIVIFVGGAVIGALAGALVSALLSRLSKVTDPGDSV